MRAILPESSLLRRLPTTINAFLNCGRPSHVSKFRSPDAVAIIPTAEAPIKIPSKIPTME
jgi:hypothetical protein